MLDRISQFLFGDDAILVEVAIFPDNLQVRLPLITAALFAYLPV